MAYTTSGNVILFTKNYTLGAVDFNKSTFVTKDNVDKFIAYSAAMIDQRLASAGFVLPLTAISGETYPAHQTAYLDFLNCLGTVNLLLPSTMPNRAGKQPEDNNFSKLFKTELDKLYDGKKHHAKLRAAYYIGTPAEQALSEPLAPMSDFMKGKVDPTKYQTLNQFTDLALRVKSTLQEEKWDYLYEFFDKGYGQSVSAFNKPNI